MKLFFNAPSILILSVVLFATANTISGQDPLLVEDFDYAAGQLLTNNGWVAHSAGGTNAIAAVSPGLAFAGYPSSGIGNAAGMTVSGEDDNRTFAAQTSGSIYAAFMVNISEAAVDSIGGYFFHLGPDPIGTTFRGRIFIKKDGSNNIAFGLSKAATADPNVAFTPFSFSLNTTYLIVLKYAIVDGTSNDAVTLYINPTLPGTEPGSPTLSALDNLTQSDISPGSVALRQGTASTSPTVVVDGIRVGTSWDSVTSGGPPAAVQHVVDFDGDGRTDFAVVRNTGGGEDGQVTWFVNHNGPGTMIGADWGIASDFFVPEDYDGDNKTDIAVWRPAAAGAGFYILQSSNSTFRFEQFGQTGDNPTVVGDYDGDGSADVAVYRAGASAGDQSTWFYRGTLSNPGGNITFVPWGQNGDFVAPGDYDGDGLGDFVVQRDNGNGQARFIRLPSSPGFDTVYFGTPTDVIVPGDYDGDGKTDLAVVRGSGGSLHWYVRPSTTGVISAAPFAVFGTSSTDFPTQGDYDGDGKTDVAVWRNGDFWFLGSTSGLGVSQWGQNGDYPVANYNAH